MKIYRIGQLLEDMIHPSVDEEIKYQERIDRSRWKNKPIESPKPPKAIETPKPLDFFKTPTERVWRYYFSQHKKIEEIAELLNMGTKEVESIIKDIKLGDKHED